MLKRKDPPEAAAADEAESVQAARIRARRRLIGAAVLVGLGIVGFPLVFETQPRPVAVDIPIEIPARAAVAPPAAAPAVPVASAPAVITERADEAAPVVARSAAAAPAAASAPVAAASKPPAPPVAQARVAASAAAGTDDAARSVARGNEEEARRAQALLDGKPVAVAAAEAAAGADAKPARFVVQAGAYSDPVALREARQRVEKLGLKTYVQVVETDTGARTRVRVGPFSTRDEAEKVAARIKGSGLAANILSL